MKPLEKTHYAVIAVTLSAITIMYWWAADPPDPWFLSFMFAAALVCIGITIARRRAGHF
ncbi:MAG TPA: hypothetical protein VHH35_19415 [Pyrinomonadaceae bacterium]|nr:hypothetical protein [Pyrinomonadaceae bacterium]